MRRQLVLGTAVLAAAALGAVPAQAAKPKPKPKPIKGSYSLTLLPDPTYEAAGLAGMPGCAGVNPQGKNSHPFTVPAAGTLHVVLDATDPTKGAYPAGPDWDLYVMDAGGEVDSSTGGTSHEETLDGFKKKTAVTIMVCNNIGAPTGTVSYTFTYK